MKNSTLQFAVFFTFFWSILTAQAQDAYHTALLAQIQAEYNITGGTWVFGNDEVVKMGQVTSYGVNMTATTVSGQDFTEVKNIQVTNPGPFSYNNAVLLNNTAAITAGDRLLFVLWVKGISGQNGGFGLAKVIIERNGTPYEQQLNVLNQYSNGWTQYLLPFESADSYAAGELHFSFQVGYEVQELEMGGIALLNYGTSYTLEQLPQKNFNDYYPGIEANAAWRTAAASRIEQYRKAALTVEVVDTLGNPIENAMVNLDMQCHEFAFGSAVVSTLFAGNSQQNAVYQDKMTNLDGEGHGFNMIVFENSLKWDAWEGNWPGTVAEKLNAINWLLAKDIRIRGHALVWPGWQWLPTYMQDNQANPSILLQNIDTHLQDILGNPTINGNIEDWDVLNEITINRDLENALAGYQTYTTGREVYPEIFDQTALLDPNTKLYINDYMTITSGGLDSENYNRYKSFLSEITNTTNIDGIGFQAHISSFPVAPQTVYDILEDFHLTYGKEMKITEFDMIGVNPSINYEYMRDFLTMTFSHPGVNGFLMWGFWDGAHWLDNAPMFDADWNLKPGGQAFIDLVFNAWWTNEMALTDAAGSSVFQAFKGKHLVQVTHNGITETTPIVLGDNQTIQIVLDGQGGCPTVGTPCDDDDPTTENDEEDGNCNCIGTPIPEDYCNLIVNGDFDLGLASWASWGTSPNAANGEAFIEIATPGTNPWDVGFNQSGLPIELGKAYTLTFDARATVDRTINVKLGFSGAPYTTYYYATDNLTTSMSSYNHSFTMTEATDLNSLVEFHLGQFSGNVYIDNVRFVENNCTPPVDCNLIGSESFTTNLGGFVGYGCSTYVVNGEVLAQIEAATPNPWGITFQYNGVTYEQGQQYELTFDARAVAARTISLKNGESAAPYTQYSISTFQLSTTMQNYRAVFTMTDPTDTNARFEFFLGNDAADVYFDNIQVQKIGCGNTTLTNLKILLEGCYDTTTLAMRSTLNDRKLLSGQTYNSNGDSLPYAYPPWNYRGTEAQTFDDNIYANMTANNNHNAVIDWILVDFRTDTPPSTSVGKKAGLLMDNGQIIFPTPIDFLESEQSYYLLVDHWAHIGAMTPAPITVTDNVLTYDFTTQDSYKPNLGIGSKQLTNGVWTLYGGNCEHTEEFPNYDINATDKQRWFLQNGKYDRYLPTDFNMDGDITGEDRVLWERNNGVFSELPR